MVMTARRGNDAYAAKSPENGGLSRRRDMGCAERGETRLSWHLRYTLSKLDNAFWLRHSSGMRQITPTDLLGQLNDVEAKFAPSVLYAEGDMRITRYPTVSIVGTRNRSDNAVQLEKLIVNRLVENSVVIVSGLAKGIDTAAHRTAIDSGGRTIAVLGTPLDRYYPKENMSLQREIMKSHFALSQFAPNAVVNPKCFPMRNRTMALISDATLIIDAGEKSGTEHQAWEAL